MTGPGTAALTRHGAAEVAAPGGRRPVTRCGRDAARGAAGPAAALGSAGERRDLRNGG